MKGDILEPLTGSEGRAMHLSRRQTTILARARALGRVEVEALADEFDVTTQTIRRDLNELSLSGLLARVHGGAVLATRVSNVAYAERRAVAAAEKHAIGLRAAQLIPDGCSVIINIGTTTEEVARALADRRDLVVVTNNLNVVGILSGGADKEIIITGGVVRQSDGAIVGDEAVEFIRKFKADFAVIGASALDEDGAIMDFDLREVAVARAIVANARRTVLVCDRLKFERSAPVRICDVAEIHAFVTDAAPPRAFAEACARAGVEVAVADAPRTIVSEAS
jgi:DeoR family transcriptional regulator, glycerol-3-phosphate regulon repressor